MTLPPRGTLAQLAVIGVLGVAVGWGARALTQPDFAKKLAPAATVDTAELAKLRKSAEQHSGQPESPRAREEREQGAANPGEKAEESQAAGNDSTASAPLKTVTFEQMMVELLGHEGVVVVDARDEATWEQGHIPGALNLDAEQAERDPSLVDKVLGDVPRNAILVVYCSGGQCDLSRRLGELLRKRGWQHVLLYEGGWSEWQEEGGPVDKGGKP